VSYQVVVLPVAQREINQLPAATGRRVLARLAALAADPRPPGCIKLTNRDAWRIRVGDYRVIYEIDDPAQTVTVVTIRHRRDVYR
jgi:mRNA interferase RelE/StbE